MLSGKGAAAVQIPDRSGFVQIARYTSGKRKMLAWEDPVSGKSKQELAALILAIFEKNTAKYGRNVKNYGVDCETLTKIKRNV